MSWFLLGHWRIVGLLLLLGYPVCGLKCIPLVHVVGFLLSGRTPCIGLDFNHSGPCHEYCLAPWVRSLLLVPLLESKVTRVQGDHTSRSPDPRSPDPRPSDLEPNSRGRLMNIVKHTHLRLIL